MPRTVKRDRDGTADTLQPAIGNVIHAEIIDGDEQDPGLLKAKEP